MSEDERSELERRWRWPAGWPRPLLDDVTRERFEALIQTLEQKLAALNQSRDTE